MASTSPTTPSTLQILRHAARKQGRLRPTSSTSSVPSNPPAKAHASSARRLFRGNAEAENPPQSRPQRLHQGHHRLPPTCFYGTGIPACIVVVDKQDAQARKGIFMIDASTGSHRIVDVFNKRLDVPKYSRTVGFDESKKTTSTSIYPATSTAKPPKTSRTSKPTSRAAFPPPTSTPSNPTGPSAPKLRQSLFKPNRTGYVDLAVEKPRIKSAIYGHPQFATFIAA